MSKHSKGSAKQFAVSAAASGPAWLIFVIIALLMH